MSVRRPGLLRIARGVWSLPMSCSAAAVRTRATSAAGRPIATAIRSACRVTRWEWPYVRLSRASSSVLRFVSA